MKRIFPLWVIIGMAHTSMGGTKPGTSWIGESGQICFDTPVKKSVSGQELRETYGSGLSQEEQRKKETELNRLPMKFEGPVSIQVNDQDDLVLPDGKGILIDKMDPVGQHKLKIKNKKGKVDQLIIFKFPNPKDPRVRISQGDFYHVDMQVNPPPKKCPWSLK